MTLILNILSKIKDYITFLIAFIFYLLDTTFMGVKNKIKIIYTVIVTGKSGDLIVKPGLLQVLYYLLTKPADSFAAEIEPPGEYLISLVGYKSNLPDEGLIKWFCDNQYVLKEDNNLVNMTREDALQKIEEIKNGLEYEIARGVGLFRKEELIKLFNGFNCVLKIETIK